MIWLWKSNFGTRCPKVEREGLQDTVSQGGRRRTSGRGVLRWKEKDFRTRCPKVKRERLRDTVSQSEKNEIQ